MQANQFLRIGLNEVKNGPPLKPGKSAFVAFIVGFLFGPVGTGIYLGTFSDFAVPMLIVLGASFMTGGIAAPVAWAFSGAWGAMRVANSNKAV